TARFSLHTPRPPRPLPSFPTRRSSDLRDFDASCPWFANPNNHPLLRPYQIEANAAIEQAIAARKRQMLVAMATGTGKTFTLVNRSEEHTSELQSRFDLVCRLLLEKKKN